MKTERRHELQHNVLADWIADTYRRIQPYTTSIIAVVISLFVLYWAYSALSSGSQKKADARWATLIPAENPADTLKEWDKVIQDYGADTPLGMAARMDTGNLCLRFGGGRMLFDRDKQVDVKDYLNRAMVCFSELEKSAKDPDVRASATLKKAEIQEYLTNPEAAKTYTAVADQFKSSPFGEFAKGRAADLAKQTTRDFQQSFSVMRTKPLPDNSLIPGTRPSDALADPPGLPGSVTDDKLKGFELPTRPGPGGDTKPLPPTPEPTKTPDDKGTEKPDAKPSDTKPELTNPQPENTKPEEKKTDATPDAAK